MMIKEEKLKHKFGIIYGITQYALAKQIAVSKEESSRFINSYFKKFPEIKDYKE